MKFPKSFESGTHKTFTYIIFSSFFLVRGEQRIQRISTVKIKLDE